MNTLKEVIASARHCAWLEKAYPNSPEFEKEVKDKANYKVHQLAETVYQHYLQAGHHPAQAEARRQQYLYINLKK